ncbi:MAG TPA: translation elongation factor 4, partial [Patescibacteria group bacterium]|nr:translation elongation factor 4 [Patescibacteria group bacterium]
MKNAEHIRNFCIIAHIDHGKSTLADRLLEITGTVSRREMKNQLLDQMDLERERGITIKLAPARMSYTLNAIPYTLNLIDTPGHVDFSYEVSRSLACVEGAILVVDATQGIQAQTIANLTLAVEQGLEIIPVINKIDLPNARVEETRLEIMHFLGCASEDIIPVSAKTGENVEKILDRIVEKVPKPKGSPANPLQALIFDSLYDDYQGVVAYIRVVNGHISKGDAIKFVQSKKDSIVLEVGTFQPKREACEELSAGETGYVVTGVKEIADIRVGDTVVQKNPALGIETPALEGYQQLKAMVFAGIYPTEGDDINRLRDALGKLKLSDASLQFEPEHSQALGFGFRAGFLGLLHVEIVRERLLREHHMDIIMTVPSVAYKIYLRGKGAEPIIIRSAQELPEVTTIDR